MKRSIRYWKCFHQLCAGRSTDDRGTGQKVKLSPVAIGRLLRRGVVALTLMVNVGIVHAGELGKVSTRTEGVTVTLLIFPGGGDGFGKVVDG